MSNTEIAPETDQRTVRPEGSEYSPVSDYQQTSDRIREKFAGDIDAYAWLLHELSQLQGRVFANGYHAGYAQGAERQFEIGANWSLAKSLRGEDQ